MRGPQRMCNDECCCIDGRDRRVIATPCDDLTGDRRSRGVLDGIAQLQRRVHPERRTRRHDHHCGNWLADNCDRRNPGYPCRTRRDLHSAYRTTCHDPALRHNRNRRVAGGPEERCRRNGVARPIVGYGTQRRRSADTDGARFRTYRDALSVSARSGCAVPASARQANA